MIDIVINPGLPDMPLRRWNCSGTYTSASTYTMLWEGSIRFEPTKAIWKCWAPLSCKLFMWLAIQYRIWTVDQWLRHGLQEESSPCFICGQEEDTVDHLLLRCVFARQTWHACFAKAGVELLLMPSTVDLLQNWWMSARKRIPKVRRKGFDSFVILICWQLWKLRNSFVFGSRTSLDMVQRFTSQIFEELRMWMRAGGHGVSAFCE